jgi:phospholipid/cholesterol/gamma-HCH transport system substrate-binding protein
MARKANPALIGAFVVGAVVLAVAGLIVFGGGKLFRTTQTVVAYFEGSLKGLAVGSPVTFNGIKVGSVTDMKVIVDPRDSSIRTPVFFEIDAGRLQEATGGAMKFTKGTPAMQRLIARGLRAQLEVQSLVTGQLAVALNLHPKTPVRLTGFSKDYPEMPTIPSSLQKLSRTLENLPIDTLVSETIQTIRSINRLVTASEVKEVLEALNQAAVSFKGLVQQVAAQVDPLMTRVDKTTTSAQAMMAAAERTLEEYRALGQDARTLVVNVNSKVEPAAAAVEKTAAAAVAALNEAQAMLDQNSPLRYDLANALREVQAAARSLRVLSDYLDRHPEAVISGKRASLQP